MEVFGIGPMELFFIVILALILMGPKDMAKAGKTIGKWLNDFVKSDTWHILRDTSKTITTLPTRLMREANLEEMKKDLNINPSLPKYEKMEAIAKAPEEYRTPDLPDNLAGEATPNVIHPPRSQPVAAEKPPIIDTPVALKAPIAADPVSEKPKRKAPAKSTTTRTKAASKSGTTPSSKTAKKPAVSGTQSKRGKKTDA